MKNELTEVQRAMHHRLRLPRPPCPRHHPAAPLHAPSPPSSHLDCSAPHHSIQTLMLYKRTGQTRGPGDKLLSAANSMLREWPLSYWLHMVSNGMQGEKKWQQRRVRSALQHLDRHCPPLRVCAHWRVPSLLWRQPCARLARAALCRPAAPPPCRCLRPLLPYCCHLHPPRQLRINVGHLRRACSKPCGA